MDCRDEWSSRIDSLQIDSILELGEVISSCSHHEKPAKMTLMASQLAGEGIARSQEEAYVMLTDACIHHEVWKLMISYDEAMKDAQESMVKMQALCVKLYRENQYFRSKLGIPARAGKE